MKPLIYLFGYDGWGPHVELMRDTFIKHNNLVRGRGLKWIDTRLRRNVRAPGFRDDMPERLLGKEHYVWINDFGNLAIAEGGALRIKDIKKGLTQLLSELRQAEKDNYDLMMFCQCDSPDCHRYTVADKILHIEEGRDIEFTEWPRSITTTVDLQDVPIKITADSLRVPVGTVIKDVGSPLTIAPGTSIAYRNEKGEGKTRIAGRVVPTADEEYAIIKTNYMLVSNVYPYSVFAALRKNDLDAMMDDMRQGSLVIPGEWTELQDEFNAAMLRGQTLFVFIVDEDRYSFIEYCARISAISMEKGENQERETICEFDNLSLIPEKVELSSLKYDDGSALSKTDGYGTAFIETPYEAITFGE